MNKLILPDGEKTCKFNLPYKDGKQQSFTTKYYYDNLDRVVKVSSPAGVYRYSYNREGKISSLRFGKDVVVKYTYDKAGRLISKVIKAGKEETILCKYEYDKLDRRIKAVVNGIKWKYKYDKYSQLICAKAVNEGEKLIYKYKYDDIGNRLAYQFGGMMPQTKYGGVSGRQVPQAYAKGGGNIKTHWCARKEFFKYNSLNQIANNGYIYDDYGNLIKTPDAEYTFDLHNRLVMVREKVRSNAFRRYKNKEGYLEIRYYYDPLGQRIKSVKTVDGTPSGTTLFLMSGMIEQARAKVASGGKQLASIDFHTLGLDLAGTLTSTGGVGSVLATSKTQTSGYYTRTYLYDGNGNVISLCKPDTGTITANYTYSPFGKLIKSGGIEIADFTFSTKYADETGLSYYGFRFYSAELGRWLSKDPTIEKGGINLYGFTYNSSINTFDIRGMCGPVVIGVTVVGTEYVLIGCTVAVCTYLVVEYGTKLIQDTVEKCEKCEPKGKPYVIPYTKTRVERKKKGKCKPCPYKRPPKRPRLDKVPPSKPHYPCKGDHIHYYYYEINQEPWPKCTCHYNSRERVICL